MHSVVISSLALAILVSACGGGGDGGTQPPPPAVFTTLTVSPAGPTLVDGDTVQLTATPRDQNGVAMAGLPAATFALTAGTSVSVSPTGRVIALNPGGSTVTATLTSGATTRTGTSTPTVGALSTAADVAVSGAGTSFSPDTVKIAVGGSVTWTFTAGANAPHNVTFATPPAGGNIGDTTTGSASRTFGTAGRFSYQCTRHGGMNGAVVVRTP
jgi:plastocyanin